MKRLFKTLLIGAGLAGAIAPQTIRDTSQTIVVERQVINEIGRAIKYAVTNTYGGIPLVTEYGNAPGLTPKQYGMRYGNGKSCKKKKNMIRVSKRTKQKIWHS